MTVYSIPGYTRRARARGSSIVSYAFGYIDCNILVHTEHNQGAVRVPTQILARNPTPLGAGVIPSLVVPRGAEHVFVVFQSTLRTPHPFRVHKRVDLSRGELW